MKSFLHYISEIFDPKTTEPPVDHPDYDGVDKRGQHVYRAGVGEDGTVETFFSVGKIEHNGKVYPNAVEAEFRVNDSWKKNDTNRNIDPREVFRAVHSHFDHFLRTHQPSAVFYDTADPVRHRIYQMAARRYGIPAINYTNMGTGATNGRYKQEQLPSTQIHENIVGPYNTKDLDRTITDVTRTLGAVDQAAVDTKGMDYDEWTKKLGLGGMRLSQGLRPRIEWVPPPQDTLTVDPKKYSLTDILKGDNLPFEIHQNTTHPQIIQDLMGASGLFTPRSSMQKPGVVPKFLWDLNNRLLNPNGHFDVDRIDLRSTQPSVDHLVTTAHELGHKVAGSRTMAPLTGKESATELVMRHLGDYRPEGVNRQYFYHFRPTELGARQYEAPALAFASLRSMMLGKANDIYTGRIDANNAREQFRTGGEFDKDWQRAIDQANMDMVHNAVRVHDQYFRGKPETQQTLERLGLTDMAKLEPQINTDLITRTGKALKNTSAADEVRDKLWKSAVDGPFSGVNLDTLPTSRWTPRGVNSELMARMKSGGRLAFAWALTQGIHDFLNGTESDNKPSNNVR